VTALAATQRPLLRVCGLCKEFQRPSPATGTRRGPWRRGGAVLRAVDGVDLEVRRGECVGLVGESGCGKTTLGRALLRLIEPDAGSVEFDGADLMALAPAELRAFRRHAQIIFQDPLGSLNPRLTAGQAIAEGIRLHRLRSGRTAVRERVRELLHLVGLPPGAEGRYPHEFSGGQRQRVGIARALSVEPSFIVCDEPVSALDVSVRAQIVNLLRDLQRQLGLAYLFIAHDLAVVRHLCDAVAVMYLGRIVEQAAADELFASPAHPYTIALLSAIPVPDPTVRGRRLVLQGDVPSPISPPPGCAFHPRCPVAEGVCRIERPELRQVRAPRAGEPSGHLAACHCLQAARDLARDALGGSRLGGQ